MKNDVIKKGLSYTNDNPLKIKLKRVILLTANFNLNKLTSIKDKLRKAGLYDSTDIKAIT